MIDLIPIVIAGGILVALGIVLVMMSWNSLKVMWNFAHSLWALITTIVSLVVVATAAYLIFDYMELSDVSNRITLEPRAMQEHVQVALKYGRSFVNSTTDWLANVLNEVIKV